MATKAASKSDAIRKVLAKQPQATASQVEGALKKEGIKASVALINKIKDGKGRNKKGRRSRKKASKAEAIRQAWDELGRKARPRDVIAALANKGIHVSSAQVSTLRARNGRVRKVRQVEVVSLHDLLAAKTLVAELGSVEDAQRALDNLARLVEA